MDSIQNIKDYLMDSLNPSIFSFNSIPGILIIILIIILIHSFYKKAIESIGWIIGILLVYELFYCLSLTGINDYIPLSYVFKYDILVSIAQLFVGTPICDGLLYVASFCAALMQRIWMLGETVFKAIWWILQICWELAQQAWTAFWTF